jgi:hypothetical protein
VGLARNESLCADWNPPKFKKKYFWLFKSHF